MNFLCKIGLHKKDPIKYVRVEKTRSNGKKYHRNYCVCMRCGKRLEKFGFKKNEK